MESSVVEGERIRLRRFTLRDFEPFARLWREPGVVRYIGPPRSVADSWASFQKAAGSWSLLGYGPWAIERLEDGRLIGQVGFFRALRGHGADFDAAPECGWVLTGAAQGQGIGREALALAHGWWDRQPFGGPSHAMIDVGNAASLGLAGAFGYRVLREVEDLGDRVALLRREG